MACRNGGTVSVPGVYGGLVDKLPMGSVMNRSLTIKTGQTHVHRYLKPLLQHIENGEIDPSFVVTHRMSLDDAPKGYDMFLNKQDETIRRRITGGTVEFTDTDVNVVGVTHEGTGVRRATRPLPST